jgi:hypothetical protein
MLYIFSTLNILGCCLCPRYLENKIEISKQNKNKNQKTSAMASTLPPSALAGFRA